MVCSWCGSKDVIAETGYIIFDDLHQEYATVCNEGRTFTQQHLNNPLFESEESYEKWCLKHPRKSRNIKFQKAIL